MLKQRVFTAVILALVFVACIYAGPVWVNVLFAVILGVAVYELTMLTLKPGLIVAVITGVLVAMLFWWFGIGMKKELMDAQVIVASVIWCGILGYLFAYRYSGNWGVILRSFFFLLGLVLLWACVNALAFMQQQLEQGGLILLYILTLVWVADIGAYFSGRKFGKHKLAPGISPGKTWEGVVGGLIANLLWMLIVFALSDGWGMGLFEFVAIGLATAAISVVGDLFESILKREAGAKDSSRLLPGHGGVLDRIDSVIAAAPVFASGLLLVGLL